MASFLLWSLVSFLYIHVHQASSQCLNKQTLYSETFRSEAFTLGPGEVQDKYYYMEFPTGHIALRGFFAEVVDEQGVPVPLSEVYLHHWVVLNRYVKQNHTQKFLAQDYSKYRSVPSKLGGNDGVCPDHTLDQFFGLGSETRHTNTSIPYPYGIVVGDPNKIPDGYEELWVLNIHAIDTRGVEDRQGCTECRCDLYNVTATKNGKPLKNYQGGLRCCTDGSQCSLSQGIPAARKKLFLQYTVEWVEWDESVVPLKVYIFDVTDTGDGCKIEYDIPSSLGLPSDSIDIRETRVVSPPSGQVIYGVAHQHSGGKGATLYGEDGREICTSLPLYGSGANAGDEVGYIVGMTSCYPKPGSVNINDKELLRLQSNYSTQQGHTGVMGLFYLLVASPQHGESTSKDGKFSSSSKSNSTLFKIVTGSKLSTSIVFGIVLASMATFIVAKHMRNRRALQYEALTA
ncbi:hypothetical protein O6H91_03G094000 [Diphasiastrum complanatum]|uniref:Uncharacterized protein n=1 Tax=Diphasiastrum complanatum TaxID=34168 RepID=A0ACC2E965_DIPCM|nr:hypothetical protein O6H91_03G094000 [Diphasiastrum complanatum]